MAKLARPTRNEKIIGAIQCVWGGPMHVHLDIVSLISYAGFAGTLTQIQSDQLAQGERATREASIVVQAHSSLVHASSVELRPSRRWASTRST